MKIIMLKGLPGSGKSTWAKAKCKADPYYVRVNKDDLRAMMSGYRPGKDEDLILNWRDLLVTRALMIGKSVIVDDTNFHPKHEARLREIAALVQAQKLVPIEFAIITVDTPLEECLKRDLGRVNPVGAKVIKQMYREYMQQAAPKPEYIDGALHAIICDLDGTLAHHNGRSPYDAAKCDTDLIDANVGRFLIDQWSRMKAIIFVSGRDAEFYDKTRAWLDKHLPFQGLLLMRPKGDRRSDDIVKQEIYDEKIKGKYNVEVVLDDRNRVVDMWRRNGLTCWQVAEGDF